MVSIESQEEAVRWALRHSSIDKLMTAETIVKNLKDIGMKISTRTVSAIARETRKALGDDSRDATAHRPPILALKQPLVRGDGPSAHPEDESEIEPGDKPLEAVLETEEQSEDDDRKLVKDAVILMADSSPTMQMAIANQGDLDAMILKWRAKVSCYAWLMFCLGVMWTRAKRHVDGLNDPFPPAKINDPIKYLWAIVFSRKRNRDPTFRLVVDGKELIFDERRPTWWFYETFFGPVETVV